MATYSVAFAKIAELAELLGVRDVGKRPGLWTERVDDGWTFKLNGAGEERFGIPPYHALIERLGLPAGLVSPGGGTVIGDAEDAFIAAMEARIARGT